MSPLRLRHSRLRPAPLTGSVLAQLSDGDRMTTLRLCGQGPTLADGDRYEVVTREPGRYEVRTYPWSAAGLRAAIAAFEGDGRP
jgi:hypothetical protein